MSSSFINASTVTFSSSRLPANRTQSITLPNGSIDGARDDEATHNKQESFRHPHMNGAGHLHPHFSNKTDAPLLFPPQPQLKRHAGSSLALEIPTTDSKHTDVVRLKAELATFFSPSLLSSSPTLNLSLFTAEQQQRSNEKDFSFLSQPQSFWNDVTALTMVDVLHTLVAKSVPQNFVRRQWRRRTRRLLLQEGGSMLHKGTIRTVNAQIAQSSILKQTKTARGIQNYGQTCFLNSILQALASLEPFVLYLERLQNADLDTNNNASASSKPANLLHALCRLLYTINGQLEGRVDTRSLLANIGAKNKQFQVNGAREQQDAQELLQALMDMLVAESDVSVVAEGDSVLSLSSFLNQIDQHQREEQEKDVFRKKTSESNQRVTEERGEEKKQDGSDENSALSIEKQGIDSELGSSSLLILDGEEGAASSVMFDSISGSTPSPLNGWIGSTLQCMRCQHVRPIQNAPFLDIPIVPTSVSRYLNGGCYSNQPTKGDPSSRFPACRLSSCLEHFTSVERVTDVDCRHCTIKQQVELWEDEVFVLKGAVDSLQSRFKLAAGSGVQEDFAKANAHLNRLRNIDADEVDTIPAGPNTLDPETGGEITTTPLFRGDALKCLLLTRLPTIICLHIQRRYYDPRLDKMAKTIQHVSFDEIMDLGRFCAYSGDDKGMTGSGDRPPTTRKAVMYKLMSAIEHRGNAFSGHYVAYRRDLANPTNWLCISDESVRNVSWRDVENSQAYMLFYEALL